MKTKKKIRNKILICGFFIMFTFVLFEGLLNKTENVSDKNIINPKISGAYNYQGELVINGESGWEACTDEDWCYGNGTWTDPYIIENVTFSTLSSTQSCIIIINSNKSFIIRNCNFTDSAFIYSEDRASYDQYDAGIKLVNTSNGLIFNNTFQNNFLGIYAHQDSENITIDDNVFIDNILYSIYLKGVEFTLTNNVMDNTGIKIPANPSQGTTKLSSRTHNIDTSNTVNGKPIYYIVNDSEKTSSSLGIGGNPGQVILVNINNSLINNLQFEGNLSNALQVLFCYHNIISDNDFKSIFHDAFSTGIFIQACVNTTIYNNNFTLNYYGIRLFNTDETVISENNFTDNTIAVFGREITTGYNATIDNNRFTNNSRGISLSDSSEFTIKNNEIAVTNREGYYGITLSNTLDTVITNNTMYAESTNSSVGMNLYQSEDNDIKNNDILGWDIGVILQEVTLYNNVSLNNMTQNILGIVLYSDANENAIQYNNLTDIIDTAILGGLCIQTNITGNNINNCANGISLSQADGSVILNNSISNHSEFGIWLDHSASVTINYNTLNTVYTNATCIGVYVSTCPGLVAIGNSCPYTNLDEDGNNGTPPAVPGYELFIIIGITSMVSYVLIRRKKTR